MTVSDCLELKCDEAVYDYKNDNNAYVTPTSSRSVQLVCKSLLSRLRVFCLLRSFFCLYCRC